MIDEEMLVGTCLSILLTSIQSLTSGDVTDEHIIEEEILEGFRSSTLLTSK